MTTLEKIIEDLKDRMSGYTDSRQPTDDEVRIAWLVSEVVELNEKLEKYTTKTEVHMEKLHEEALQQNALGVPYIYMDKEDYDGTHQLQDQDDEHILWAIRFTNKKQSSLIRSYWRENPIGYYLGIETKEEGIVYRISKLFERYIDMKKYSEKILGKIKLSTTGKVPSIFL